MYASVAASALKFGPACASAGIGITAGIAVELPAPGAAGVSCAAIAAGKTHAATTTKHNTAPHRAVKFISCPRRGGFTPPSFLSAAIFSGQLPPPPVQVATV